MGSPNNRPTKNIGCQSLNEYFYRFFPRFLMASTFLTFSAHFWLVERLGQKGSPNNRPTKILAAKAYMYFYRFFSQIFNGEHIFGFFGTFLASRAALLAKMLNLQKMGQKLQKMCLPLKIQEKTYKNTHLSLLNLNNFLSYLFFQQHPASAHCIIQPLSELAI